ncbi:MAG TPA: hypothetical protein VKO63_08150 [Chitinispirillaceae bacterium]|nr:hypothetical protein [Chitinispirillaceae bacterium]
MEKKTPFIIKILFLMPVLLGVLCTVPKKQILPDVSLTTTVRDSVVTDSIRKSHTITHDTLPKTIQIQDWVNKDFVVLPKQQMFRVHGYEIYFSKNLDKATSSPDTTLELKNHRIKSEKLSNHLITCVLVERAGAEWLLECYDSLLNRSLYMVSYKGAFKDLLYKDDLEQASLRWNGKKIFSRRGLISTVDKNGSFSSIKVDIRDSLIVQGVTAGVTPLPVKPLWINVQSKKGSGFIPVRISWTNCMNDVVSDSLPWADDIFEADPAQYGWSDTMWELINNHRVVKEMTKGQVLVSWGFPISKLIPQGTTDECWMYQVQKVCFANGVVSTITSE